jgi:cobaltochelatase CobS
MALIKHSVRTVRRPCKQCGSSELYWAHDTEGKPGKGYCAEHQSANFTLINRDGTRHDCQGKYASSGESDSHEPESAETEPWIEPVWTPEPTPTAPVTAPTATTGNAAMDAFTAFMNAIAPKVDADQVQAIIDDRLRGLVLPVRVEVTRNGQTKPIEGLAHSALPLVIGILADGDHVLMVGPAGTGKSHIAGQAAEALGLESHGISLSPQTPASALLGYLQAAGEYVSTQFRHTYEHGGVFHFDEMDNAHPSTLAVTNGALANGHMDFPDGRVKRHEDFRAVGSANTYGRGPDRAYVGRQAIDAATLDRFEMVDVDYDEALEEALCLATGLDGIRVKKVLAYVRYLRAQAITYKLPLTFGPRRSRGMCKRLASGMSVGQALEISVRRGISDTDWRKVSDGAPGI